MWIVYTSPVLLSCALTGLQLTGIVWSAIFNNDLIKFSAHPVPKPLLHSDLRLTSPQLLNSAGVLLITQAILVLQPTHTPKQKKDGTNTHAILNATAMTSLIAGLVVVLITKFEHSGTHFESLHAKLGLITYLFLIVQTSVGATMYYLPGVYGGVSQAKSIWKYHRMSGYILLVLMLGTVAAATQTDYNKNVLEMRLWAVSVAAALVLVGVIPRIKKQKLGF